MMSKRLMNATRHVSKSPYHLSTATKAATALWKAASSWTSTVAGDGQPQPDAWASGQELGKPARRHGRAPLGLGFPSNRVRKPGAVTGNVRLLPVGLGGDRGDEVAGHRRSMAAIAPFAAIDVVDVLSELFNLPLTVKPDLSPEADQTGVAHRQTEPCASGRPRRRQGAKPGPCDGAASWKAQNRTLSGSVTGQDRLSFADRALPTVRIHRWIR